MPVQTHKSHLQIIILVLLFWGGLSSCQDDVIIDPPPPSTPPSSLKYKPDNLSIDSGTATISVIPDVEGTQPMKFKMFSTPAVGNHIRIEEETGVIRIAETTPVGTYVLSVSAENEVGLVEFDDVYKVTVLKRGPRISFEGHIKNIILDNCKRCHSPIGVDTDYTDYQTAKDSVDVLIERVNLEPSDPGFMPYSGQKLSPATIALLEQWKADGMPEN